MLIDELDRQDMRGSNHLVLPTTSALFIGERLWGERWSTIVGFNLPLETQEFIVDGQLVEEVAAKVMSVGQAVRFFSFAFTERSTLSIQFSVLASVIFGEPVEVTPTTGMRVHLATDQGFSMYIGGLASYGLKGSVLLYGVSQRF